VPDQELARPVSTYRLQLTAGFGFAQVAGLGGYLSALGVSHVYLSPILQAAPGSAHGYDVVDHSRISAELGGEAGFRAMVAALRGHGLGVVADVVPNHMAIPQPESLNRQLWSVLAGGPGSRFAHWFDVDWAAGDGRFLLPILAGPVTSCLPDLRLDPAGDPAAGIAGPVLRYFGHLLPVRAGTEHLPLDGLLAAQHYRLAPWQDVANLNWRRFFDVTSLIAVRVEDPRVFSATHGLLLALAAEGLIDGLRVDHPDGLADPRGYLQRLAEASGDRWVVAEKILSGSETLPPDWACAGTTGYDALAAADALFTDPAGTGPLTACYQHFTGGPGRFALVAHAARREVAGTLLAAEVGRLARLAARAGQPALARVSGHDLRTVLAELLAGFGVYRAYLVPGEPAGQATVAAVRAAAAAARRQLPRRLHTVLRVVTGLVLGGGAPAEGPASTGPASTGAQFAVAFQQTCGPVQAKGVEDTACYRWSRLVSRNEVGGDPERLGGTPAEFHAFAGHLADCWPATMTTLSTHDTKRQEDVRARLAVLAESAPAWARAVERWHARAATLCRDRPPEADTEYLLWQTLAGAWPISGDRLAGYLRKAMREAKTATSWISPDPGYEAAVLSFAAAVLADPLLTGWIGEFVAAMAPPARVNSLGMKLVQLTMPGVPDVYQGCELAGFALVDPDNRRPVDFGHRAGLLARLEAGQPGPQTHSVQPADWLDAEKLLVTSAALRLRRAHPDWFAGSYQPLAAQGPAAGHCVAFCRGDQAVTVATRLPAGLAAAGGWRGTVLPLPAGPAGAGGWQDVLTGTVHRAPAPPLAELTRRLPVALLVPSRPGQPAAGGAR
jgi:(1->4)-alpha-D-glucan 1-alpha-D-glucosylmutase